MGKVIDFNTYMLNRDKPRTDSDQPKKAIAKAGNKLFILVGIPGSGKTTYANKFLANPQTIIVSTDEIRNELTGSYKFSAESNNEVFDNAKKKVQFALAQGFDVVFDATNTNKKHRKSFIDIAHKQNCSVVAIVFMTPLSVCLQQNSFRSNERKVPDDVIIAMSGYNSRIDKSEGYSEIIYI